MAVAAHMNSEPPVCLPPLNQQRNVRKLALFSFVLSIILVPINDAFFSTIVG
jgi:hypothetical protein